MKSTFVLVIAGVAAGAALGATAMYTQSAKDNKKTTAPATAPSGDMQDMPLPAGWTKEDMQKCMVAGEIGPMQKFLAESAGTWEGKNTMWMSPEAEPMVTDAKCVTTAIMDGRYTKSQMSGDMGAMGPFTGQAIYGYDNVAKTFQCAWIDNCATGIMYGTGVLSPDKKTMTWTFTANCPLAGKPITMREVDRFVDKNTTIVEMYGPWHKTGKEFKTMELKMTRKSGVATTEKSE